MKWCPSHACTAYLYNMDSGRWPRLTLCLESVVNDIGVLRLGVWRVLHLDDNHLLGEDKLLWR
jgi:hypothetical protein